MLKKSRAPQTTSPPLPAASIRQPSLPLLRYYSLAPLHLIFTLFSIYALPSRPFLSLNPPPPPPQGAPALSALAASVATYVDAPCASLLLASAGLLATQLWWSSYLRAWRKSAGKTPEQLHKEAEDRLAARGGAGWSKMIKSGAKLQLSRDAKASVLRATAPVQEAVTITLIGTVGIHVAAVLLGAPFLRHFFRTLLLSLYVAMLAVYPTAQAVGWNQGREKATWVRIYSSLEPKNDLEIALFCPAVGTVVGCWLGAIPIPLDWDRPWQAWPTTCILGASFGHVVGSVVAMLLCAVGGEPQPGHHLDPAYTGAAVASGGKKAGQGSTAGAAPLLRQRHKKR